VFGIQIAQIAVKYDLDVQEPLAYIIHTALPSEQNYDQEFYLDYDYEHQQQPEED
jgi:hypothetical protein